MVIRIITLTGTTKILALGGLGEVFLGFLGVRGGGGLCQDRNAVNVGSGNHGGRLTGGT